MIHGPIHYPILASGWEFLLARFPSSFILTENVEPKICLGVLKAIQTAQPSIKIRKIQNSYFCPLAHDRFFLRLFFPSFFTSRHDLFSMIAIE
jgi:hypothetical protein